ncbi:unnamed protein product [Adineta steineri]|uniref:Uncharacterized protein n=1 Tax=Adineta steineri TaxID=433720 RepID=A0A819PXA9_9BILA|nr:unnamed protein product [Adineta steineri]
MISNVTPGTFEKLYFEHDQTLSCPCSTIAIPYRNFTSNNVTMHSVCSSIFIEPEWIKGLYFSNASQYGVWDFRTTAHSQFELLSSFCSFSKEIISQTESDIDNNKLVTLYLLPQEQVKLQIDGTIDLLKNIASSQMITYLNYSRNTIETNYLVSALNTNLIITTIPSYESVVTAAGQVSYPFNHLSSKLCGDEKIVSDASLSQVIYELIEVNRRHKMDPMPNSTIVNGFFTGCTPLEALLKSTLDCLYQTECLRLLVDYFPIRQQINFHANNSVLTSKHENISVNEYLNNLFIVNWSTEINYTKYFHQCSPSNCTYSKKDGTELTYGIALFISLYGGLIIILRLIASWSIDILSKIKCCSRETNENSDQNGKMLKFIESIKRLNLFKNVNDRTANSIKQQKTITCVYLILLTGSICILCLFTSLNSETVTKVEKNPSLTTYKSLQGLYNASLQCPCFNKAIVHQKIVSLSPHFHQICSSGFVDDDWIAMIRKSSSDNIYKDWRFRASPVFRLLSEFCQLANKTINDAVKQYLSQLFIASFVMNEDDFDKQLASSLNQFYQSTVHNFDLMANVLQLLMHIDQLYMAANRRAAHNLDTNLIGNVVQNKTNTTKLVKLKFILNQIEEINSSMITCVCATDPYCKVPAVTYDSKYDQKISNRSNLIYNVPGWIRGCLPIDSLLLSTLQYLYEDADYFPFLLSYTKKTFEIVGRNQSSLIIHPMVYNPTMSRFPPNTTVSTMFRKMMIEEWNPSPSYQSFYKLCAPIYCTFRIIRTKSFITVIIELIATIGGVVALLRIVTPYLIKFIAQLPTICKKKEQHQPRERVHRSCVDRIRIMIRNLIKLLSTRVTELNIFSTRDFGSNTDQITAKRYGRWATRLYIILFLSCLIILIFYTTIQPHSLTKTFDQPSFIRYIHLKKTYGNKLKCSCSKIASTYDRFVEIKPEFHSICSSEFISEQWRIGIANGLVSNLSIYSQKDYRRFISAHIQYLQGLCRLSQQSVNNAVNQSLTSLLVTIELLSEQNFYDHLNNSIEQSKSNAPILLSRLLFITRTVNHGNAFISTYVTNFEYITLLIGSKQNYAYTEGIIYDNECSCSLYSNCTTQATFIDENSSEVIPVKGLKIGCTPSESFRLSTLECFYDQSCLDLILNYTNYHNSTTPLSTISSRFPKNTTIDELIKNLFNEQWFNQSNYSSYYEQCSPLLCSYTDIARFNILYTITLFLGLQGGLAIVLKWVCPKLVRIVSTINRYRKRRRTSIHPDNSLEILSDSSIIHSTTLNVEITRIDNITPEAIIISPIRRYSNIISIIVLLIFLIVGIIIFSIYYAKHVSASDTTMDGSLNTTASTVILTSSTTPEPFCQLEFELISINMSCAEKDLRLVLSVAADFNNDNQVDLAYICNFQLTQKMTLLFGIGNGKFQEPIKFTLESFKSVIQAYVADVNNDNRSDLILVHMSGKDAVLAILLVNENGTFQIQNMLSRIIGPAPHQISVIDLNNDKKLDIVMILSDDCNVYVMFGNGNANFSSELIVSVGIICDPKGLVVGDVNSDSYLDIVVYDQKSLHMYVFFGQSNGTFQSPKWFFTAIDAKISKIVIGDFDNDDQSDIGFIYTWNDLVYMIYQYNNNSFSINERTIIKSNQNLHSAVVGDINGDNHLDIIINLYSPCRIYALLGYGNGKFSRQTIYSNETEYGNNWISLNVFNTCGNNNGECIDPFAASTVPPVTMSTTTTILVPTLTIGGFIIFVCLIVVCYIYNIRRLRQSRISAVNTMNQTVVYQNAQQSTGESTVLFDVQSHYNSNTSSPFPPNSARPEAPPPPYEAANTNSLIKCPSEPPPPPYEIATIEQTIT